MPTPLELVGDAPLKTLYCAFDVYPSAKGAATHINHFADALFTYAAPGLLYVMGEPALPPYQREGERYIARFSRAVPGYLERAFAFGHELQHFLETQKPPLTLCHFRDPFSGHAVIEANNANGGGAKTLFEVNGLPSVELKSRYPLLTERTLHKLRVLEDAVAQQCDAIVVPSQVTAGLLADRGVASAKITVIPNGAQPVPDGEMPLKIENPYVIYFGAVQPWQGVDVLLKAFARLADLNIDLVVCASTKEKTTRPLQRLARRLGIADRVHFTHRLSKPELGALLRRASVSVAPLTACERNLVQGCSPLKVLETFSAGVPLVASDLPAVREVCPTGEDAALFVPPDRPGLLARAIRRTLDEPEAAAKRAARGLAHVQAHGGWQRARDALEAVYARLAPVRDASSVLPLANARMGSS